MNNLHLPHTEGVTQAGVVAGLPGYKQIKNFIEHIYSIIIFASVTIMLSSGAQLLVASAIQTNQVVVAKISVAEWQKLISGKRGVPHKVAWRIKITAASSFGGFYIKGHLRDTRSAKVHLIWPPESPPADAIGDRLVVGNTISIMGEFEGVTQEKEAIIRVRECLH